MIHDTTTDPVVDSLF